MFEHLFEHYQQENRSVNNFRTDRFILDLLGFGVLNGPLTSLKHPSLYLYVSQNTFNYIMNEMIYIYIYIYTRVWEKEVRIGNALREV